MRQTVKTPAAGGASRAGLETVLFDVDGVVTDTAAAHAVAWKELFDDYLAGRNADFRPFDPDSDYRTYVDGKPRYDGVRSFLQSRGIDLPFGSESDGPDAETICGLGNRKDGFFRRWLDRNEVEAFPGTLALFEDLKRAGVRIAAFSSSRNARTVLRSAGVADVFDATVDGSDMAGLGLPGKPDPAILFQAAGLLQAEPARTAVVEDAVSGVSAGAAGRFVQVIGVDRDGASEDLERAGASLVVGDLAELRLDGSGWLSARTIASTPSATDARNHLQTQIAGRRIAVFLDYDGCLTPLVDDPKDAVLAPGMRAALSRLAERAPVAIVSGRDLDDVRGLVDDDSLYFAGSHGFDLAGPDGWRDGLKQGEAFIGDLEAAADALEAAIGSIDGARVERKKFALAVHFRQASAEGERQVAEVVRETMRDFARLRASPGAKIFDVKPRIDWHKGRAVLALMERLGLDGPDVAAFYLGDDTTDEDAFRVLSARGFAVVVRGGDDRRTSARYALDGVGEVEGFLNWLATQAERTG